MLGLDLTDNVRFDWEQKDIEYQIQWRLL